jgi:RNA polymerase sigma factor (sigma-70 family)
VFFTTKPSADDHDLARRYKETGDQNLLAQLFSNYTSMVYGVCLKYLKDREEARDAVMQIFETLIQSLREHTVDNFKGWLYVTSRNHCLMQLRKQKHHQMEEISDRNMENELFLHPADESEPEQDLEKMEKCIEELVEEQKKCVQLFFLQEKCYKDITTVTGFDLNKVKSYIQNGKRNLKICMERNA